MVKRREGNIHGQFGVDFVDEISGNLGLNQHRLVLGNHIHNVEAALNHAAYSVDIQAHHNAINR